MIPEEDQSLIEVLKLSDPSLVQSLLLLKNNSSAENQQVVMLNRARNILAKYSQLTIQLKFHGIEFILATGKASNINAN